MSNMRHVTERIEREEFARGHIAPGDTPAVPRPAATIVLAWPEPGTTTYRVLLLKRPDTARFAAGAYVFAGGVIDEADGTPEALCLLPPDLRQPEGPAAVAALRELFEETGFLIADRPVNAERAARVRGSLLRGELGFAEAAAELGATFRNVRAAYLSRWVTPARFARRYDTRFFLTILDAETPPDPELTQELVGHVWITPAEAVRAFAAAELPMLFPTLSTLQQLTEETDIGALLTSCRGSEPEAVEPRLVVRGDSVRPVLPGDSEYDEAE